MHPACYGPCHGIIDASCSTRQHPSSRTIVRYMTQHADHWITQAHIKVRRFMFMPVARCNRRRLQPVATVMDIEDSMGMHGNPNPHTPCSIPTTTLPASGMPFSGFCVAQTMIKSGLWRTAQSRQACHAPRDGGRRSRMAAR
eukprot:350618-Chlamydomonas_euryale.AAC.7